MPICIHTELDQLLGVIPPRSPFGARDRAMILFDLHTGLRVSELCGLIVHHVAFQLQPRRRLDFPAALGKGGRSRVIPLNSVARQAVVDLLEFNRVRGFQVAPAAPLLYNRDHQPLTPRAVRAIMQKYREAAGLDVKASPHSLRHTFASRIVAATGNAHYAKELLGHRRLNTVEHYLHSQPHQLDQAVELLADF
jgi:site-specific recombinase XerD